MSVPSYDEDSQLYASESTGNINTATLKSRRRKGVLDLLLPSPTPPSCITRSDSSDWRLIHCLTDSDSGSVDAEEEVFEFPRPPRATLETHATFFSRYSHSPQSSSDSTPSLLSSHGSSHHPSSPTSSGPPTTPTSPTLSLRGTTLPPGIVLVRPLSIRKRSAASPPPKLPAAETELDTPHNDNDDSEFYAADARTFVTLSRPPPPVPHHHARAPSEVCGPRPRTRSPSSRPATAPSSTPAARDVEKDDKVSPRPPFPRRPPPPPPTSLPTGPALAPHTPPRSSSLHHPHSSPPPSSFKPPSSYSSHQHSPSNSISSTSTSTSSSTAPLAASPSSSPSRQLSLTRRAHVRVHRVPNFSRPTSQIALLQPSNSNSNSNSRSTSSPDPSTSSRDFPIPSEAAATRDSSYSFAAEYAAYAPLLRTPTPGLCVTFTPGMLTFDGVRGSGSGGSRGSGGEEEDGDGDGEIHVHPWREGDSDDEEEDEVDGGEDGEEDKNTPYQYRLSPLIALAPVMVEESEDDDQYFFDDRGYRRGRPSWDADSDAYALLPYEEPGGRASTESGSGSSYSHYPATTVSSCDARSSSCSGVSVRYPPPVDAPPRVPMKDASRSSAFAPPPLPPLPTSTSPPTSTSTPTPTLRSHWSSSTLSTASHPPSHSPSKQKRKSSSSSSGSSLAFARRYLKGAGGKTRKGGKDVSLMTGSSQETKNVQPKPRLRPMGAVSPRVVR
ncbi:hypothetical protein R3P38DRAFT_3423412 [Favolaschia claudopus]|uniref:Uncharacterized protein n=1 Tax=Favolaschia claudopus TaxID=2862362 RepID=A0AAW0D6L6_9AGAR